MKIYRITLVLFIILNSVLLCQQVDNLVKEGDKLTDTFNDQSALEKYLLADKISPKNWDILWKISRSYVNIGVHMPESTSD